MKKNYFWKNRFLRADKIIAVIYSPVRVLKYQLGNDAFYWSGLSKYNIAAQSLNYAVQWVTEWYSYNDKMLEYLGGDVSKDKMAGLYKVKKEDPVREN